MINTQWVSKNRYINLTWNPTVFSLFFFMIFLTQTLSAGFYEENKIQGFYFFEDPKEGGKAEQNNPQTPEEAEEIMAEQREELYKLRCLAILSPTKKNLISYIERHNKMISIADRFAKSWEHVLLDLPELGGGHTFSSSAVGIDVRKRAEEAYKLRTLDALGEKFFLLMFADGGDPYSEEAAQILNRFKDVTDWHIRVVSTNGLPLQAFPKPEKNQGLAERYNVEKVPAFLIINPDTKEGYPVGIGVLSIPELIDNIHIQAERHLLGERR